MTTLMPMRPTLLQQSRRRATATELVAANVRAAFAIAFLHATDLGRLLDVSYPTARSRWHGRTSYKVDEVVRIAAFLECPPGDLFARGRE